MVYLRKGIGVQLKDIKVFNRARQQGNNEGKMYFQGMLGCFSKPDKINGEFIFNSSSGFLSRP